MLLPIALKAINHLLTGESWARQRLQAFAGQSLRLELGRFQLPLEIDSSGLLIAQAASRAGATLIPAVTITLPGDAPARFLLDRTSLVGLIRISGSAELAECLNFIFKNLRWDAEHDLAQAVGDIAARRLLAGGLQFARWQVRQMKNLAGNLAEFFTIEQGTLVPREDVTDFATAVIATSDAVEQLAARVARLEKLGK